MHEFLDIERIDLPLLIDHRNAEGTQKWLESECEITPEQQLRWFENGGHKNYRIIKLVGGPRIGLARIKLLEDDMCQIGLDIFQEFRGQGLSTAALESLMKYALRRSKKLELWVFRENSAAVKVYRKCGFSIDESTPPRNLQRSWGPSGAHYAYIRMAYEP
jgi:RimJ/RimL family protein N-acetyltransferase